MAQPPANPAANLRQIPLTPQQRAAYSTVESAQGGKLLDAARLTNAAPDHGHIASSLLYDCFEHLILSVIAHSTEPIVDHYRQPDIHGIRRRQFEAMYRDRAPRQFGALRIIVSRRNAIRYVNPQHPIPPWTIAENATAAVAGYIGTMAGFEAWVRAQLSRPYTPPPPAQGQSSGGQPSGAPRPVGRRRRP